MFEHDSIRRKQMLIIMLTSGVALLLACAGFVTFDVVTYRDAMTRRLTTLAEILGNNSTGALDFNDRTVAEEVLAALRAEPDIVAACIYTKDGRIFATYLKGGAGAGRLPAAPEVEGHRFERRRLVLFHRIVQQNETVGTIFLQSSLEALSRRLRLYAAIAAGVLLAAALVAFVLSAWLQRIISGPILDLVQATRSVARQKNYAVRVPRKSQDELGLLIDDFNEMLAQIQTRDAALQQAQADLERRVLERTGELQAEVAERRRTEDLLRRQFSRLSLLNQIARAVAERMDLSSILSVMLHNLEEHLPIDFGAAYLFDAERSLLTVAAHGPGSAAQALRAQETVGSVVPLHPACAERFSRGETLMLADAARLGCLLGERWLNAGLPSGALLPLMIESKFFGLLLVARRDPAGFSSGEGEFLQMVTEQVALAARQAQLHAELQGAYDELRATQLAVLQQERLRALGQMASGIAHDINNALAPIVGFSDLMLTTDTNLTPRSREHLERIKTAGVDIARTVDRMREFYRQRDEAEKLLRLDVNKLVREAVDLSRPRWRDIPQERGVVVQLRTELDPDLPAILGVESEIRQALINLILNAVDAMPQGGTLTLRTRLADLPPDGGQEPPGRWLYLEVIDTGVGMDDETRRRCLEPFFSTKGNRGTGLGLAMVYGAMERHGGRVGIESAVGKGTMVRLVFSLNEPARVTENAVVPVAAPLPSLRILCIDDEPVVLSVLSEMLAGCGHVVTSSLSGETGLEAFRQGLADHCPFDVVITDLGMAVMDGRAVAQAVRRDSPDTPVILLTGWGMFMKSAGDVPADVDCVLSKPITAGDLRRGLESVMRRERDGERPRG